jgi:secreted Zn-dependent insulinase-like peptidase
MTARYGVIVCPKCGMAKGVEADKKTTTCPCGRDIDMKRVKLMFLTDSPHELADSVAKTNASLRGGGHIPSEKKSRKKDPYAEIADRAKPIKDPLERMKVVSSELSKLKQDFTMDDLRKVASILGKDSPEDMLIRLLEHNLVYEVSEGTYRAV